VPSRHGALVRAKTQLSRLAPLARGRLHACKDIVVVVAAAVILPTLLQDRLKPCGIAQSEPAAEDSNLRISQPTASLSADGAAPADTVSTQAFGCIWIGRCKHAHI
jgi:hypothetical protein